MVSQKELIDYIEKVKVRKPNNPGQSYAVADLITNIPQTIELLYQVVASKTDQSLNRFEDDFFHHLNSIVHLDSISNLPIAIEGLSQKYESFLKKIAYLKYKDKDTRYFYGDKYTKGITGTSLGKLCEGLLDNTDKGNDDGVIPLELPDKLFNYKGVNRYFSDFVRTELRNKVHYALDYPRNEIILLSEIVILLYLLTIQDNFHFLSNIFFKESKYLNSIAEQFNKWQARFVHILGVEDYDSIIDNIDLDFVESDFDLSELEDELENGDELEEKFSDRERGKISELLNRNRRLIIIGSPGMGKTTTLQFLCFHLAKSNEKIPVYLELRNFTEELDLVEELSRVIGIEEDLFYDLLNSDRLVILLDGLNEIIRRDARAKLFQQVNYLLKLSETFFFIASSRKSAYHNDFNLPVFQLQLMNDEQIEEFISKNYQPNYSIFLELLKKNQRINEWARNPLMLTMLISVAKKFGGKIPDNTGKLMRTFIDGIYKREIKRNPTYNSEIAQILLSDLAFTSREDKLVGFKKVYALEVLRAKKNQLGLQEDILRILNSFIDINILYENESQLGFTHELYQEYYAAEYLLTSYNLDKEMITKYVEDKNWHEVIILFNGLNDDELAVKTIANSNPLVAALAVNDTINPKLESVDIVLQTAKSKLNDGESSSSISNSLKSLITLKKLDEVYSILFQTKPQSKEFKKAIRSAISDCYDLISQNEMIDLLELIWRLFRDTAAEVNFLSAFFKNIPINGLIELDEFHKEKAHILTIKFIDHYLNKTQVKGSEENRLNIHRTYLIKPLIVLPADKLIAPSLKKKVLSVTKTLIGIKKTELAYPIIKKYQLEDSIDLTKLISRLILTNSPEKAKLLAVIFYDDDFAINQKRETILKLALQHSKGIVYKTAVELAIENGYKEKFIDLIDTKKLESISETSNGTKIVIPEPITKFQLDMNSSMETNINSFLQFCDGNNKIPMIKYISMFIEKFPGQYSLFYKLLSQKVFEGTVVTKYDYGMFINCKLFQRTKTVFVHHTSTSQAYETIQENENIKFQIIGFNKDKQRINAKMC